MKVFVIQYLNRNILDSIMPSNHLIKFIVTKSQYEQIKTDAEIKGFNTLSSYLRDLTLGKNGLMEGMIVEIYKRVVKNEQKRPKNT